MAKKWKQHKCPLSDEWINKMWYIHILEYYLSIKKNGDFPGGPMLKTPHSQCRGSGSIPDQGTRSHMPQLRPSAAK